MTWVILDDQGRAGWIGPEPTERAVWVDGQDLETLLTHRVVGHTVVDGWVVGGKWVLRDPVVDPGPSPEAVAALEAEAAAAQFAAEESERKMRGVEFDGVMCSATGQDQSGLMAVLTGIELAKAIGSDYGTTGFIFENGTRINISTQNAYQLAAVWVPFRKSFFPPGA